ncbi:hypothetical protein V8G54_013900 [Vigna mungo]|uniref:Uncharacterized protein n=1 Tax=Vigna mungo TaxID=3915 RepID=A0AAQ3NI38_VIGMU
MAATRERNLLHPPSLKHRKLSPARAIINLINRIVNRATPHEFVIYITGPTKQNPEKNRNGSLSPNLHCGVTISLASSSSTCKQKITRSAPLETNLESSPPSSSIIVVVVEA